MLRLESPAPLEADGGATVLDTEVVTPALRDLPGMDVRDANNNLDVARHDGRVYLAFRTAPHHFASTEAALYVVSSADERRWRFETRVALGRDLREPRLLSWKGQLFLYFATLGTSIFEFSPDKMMGLVRGSDGRWAAAREVYRPGFIPWRTRVVDGRPYMAAYGDGRHIYAWDNVPLEVHWLTTDDGWNWRPAIEGQPAVLKGGGSETDFVDAPGGGFVAVVRNEAGDGDGWGSKICRSQGPTGKWSCRTDPRKFDSPLLFRQGDSVYLIARRHLRRDGAYDLGLRQLPLALQTVTYQLDYWRYPKRCAVWRVDPRSLDVTWEVDLPSRGDTCFPAVEAQSDGLVAVYNYSSPIDGPDVPWLAGQLGRTDIYRSVIRLDPAPRLAAAPNSGSALGAGARRTER